RQPARDTSGGVRSMIDALLCPRSRVHWVSCVLLWAVFGAYAATWIHAHWGYLFDPLLQNDDARTSLFQFHRWGPEGALRDDAIANEMMVITTPGYRLFYPVLVPVIGLYATSKVVQLVCLGILVAAAVILARARQAGLAGALLLLFFALHTPYVVNRIGGGHGRGFAFPLMALWTSGIIARSHRSRFSATAIAALFYPPVMLLLLAAEGLVAARGLPGLPVERPPKRFKRYAVLAAVCVACSVPLVIRNAQYGRVHTYAEARADPGFVHNPRNVLPYEPMLSAAARHLGHPLHANGDGPIPAVTDLYAKFGLVGPLIVIAGLGVLVLRRRCVPPTAAAALLVAALATYVAARVFAFRLYSPVRYLSYGAVAATLALAVTTLGTLWPAYRDRAARAVRCNFVALAVICLTWLVAGDGIIRDRASIRDGVVGSNGANINERDHAALYAFIRTLPVEARIAMHPGDGAGISYWTARATTEHHETLQPWLVEPWQRAKANTFATLAAMYTTDTADLLSYCDGRGITHLLVHAARYSRAYRENARFFPPFDGFVAERLEGVRREDLAVIRVTDDSIVFHDAPWVILEVDRIRTAVASAQVAE
ncbi:MAG: hypothetical protein ACYTGF_08945, partial [Planctomycetota bacterium]